LRQKTTLAQWRTAKAQANADAPKGGPQAVISKGDRALIKEVMRQIRVQGGNVHAVLGR
jgi:hypothetical protein